MEKRKHHRVNCEIASTYKNLDDAVRPTLSETTVWDISEGGMRLRTARFVPVHHRLWVKMNIPHRKSVEVVAKPAWIRELPSTGQFEIGAQFVTLTDEDRSLIQSLVRNNRPISPSPSF